MTEATQTKRKYKKKDILSRIGRRPVEIPEGTKVSVNGKAINVEGKKGKLSFVLPELIGAKVEDKNLVFNVLKSHPDSKSYHGMTRKIVANMVEGVNSGFSKKLIIEGVGFKAAVSGDKLTLTLGFSHPVVFPVPKGITVKVEGKGGNELFVEGTDKQMVGQVAAQIRSIKKPEVYKGTGIRYDGEVVRRKIGKAAVAGGGKK